MNDQPAVSGPLSQMPGMQAQQNPPVQVDAPSVADYQPPEPEKDQTLESQNIFEMLGVTEGSEQEREAFLDELQDVVWQDFIKNDVQQLITQEELAELKKLSGQEEMLTFLEKLIPDLEEIMLEKALELKADLFKERILDLKNSYQDDQAALAKITEAEQKSQADQWAEAAEILNALDS